MPQTESCTSPYGPINCGGILSGSKLMTSTLQGGANQTITYEYALPAFHYNSQQPPFGDRLSAPVGSTAYLCFCNSMLEKTTERASSPPGSDQIEPPILRQKWSKNMSMMSRGGSLDFVRKTHMYCEASSTTRRYNKYPSQESITQSVVLFGLE